MKEHRVRANDIARIVGKVVATMINNGLKCPNSSKERRLSIVETGYCEADGEADHVYWDSFQRVIVESTVGVRYIDLVMHRVNVFCCELSVNLHLGW